ncbi:hypothetical protein Moror_4626 [Moniliophthora roreri MCA 2997]|uniref:Uncharacterized protein n=1 Tax=Moniliophthora roreri (strain MCA 2997) TaxID=1381753 RepID=V2XHM8_MONRO|nr:hypothetical protein Moror_4626 [Moniliophthora roreri MCA 2997]
MKFSANTSSYGRLSHSSSEHTNVQPSSRRKRKPTTSRSNGNAILGRKPSMEWRMNGRKRIMNKIARQPSLQQCASPNIHTPRKISQPEVISHLFSIPEDPPSSNRTEPSNNSQKDQQYLQKLMQFVSPVKQDRNAAKLRRTESLRRLSKARTKVSPDQILEWNANLSDSQRTVFLAQADAVPRIPVGHPVPRLHLSMLGKPLIPGSASFYVQGEEGYERYTSSRDAKERYIKAIRGEAKWEGEERRMRKTEMREREHREQERRRLEEAQTRRAAEEAERRRQAEREAEVLRRRQARKREEENERKRVEEEKRRERILADRESQRKQKEEEEKERSCQKEAPVPIDPFDLYDLKWAIIRRECKEHEVPSDLSFHQLPWPTVGEVYMPDHLSFQNVEAFVLSGARRGVWLGKSWKERIRLEMLKWHPDRFCAQVLPLVRASDRDATVQGANRVTGYLNSIREKNEAMS